MRHLQTIQIRQKFGRFGSRNRLLSRKATEADVHAEGSRAAESNASYEVTSPIILTTSRRVLLARRDLFITRYQIAASLDGLPLLFPTKSATLRGPVLTVPSDAVIFLSEQRNSLSGIKMHCVLPACKWNSLRSCYLKSPHPVPPLEGRGLCIAKVLISA